MSRASGLFESRGFSQKRNRNLVGSPKRRLLLLLEEKHLPTKTSRPLRSLKTRDKEAKLHQKVEKLIFFMSYFKQFPQRILGTHDTEGLTQLWGQMTHCGSGVSRNLHWENTAHEDASGEMERERGQWQGQTSRSRTMETLLEQGGGGIYKCSDC